MNQEILKDKTNYLQELLQIETMIREIYIISPDIYDLISKIKEFENIDVHYDDNDSQIILCITYKHSTMSFTQPTLHIYIKDGNIESNRDEIEDCLNKIKNVE